MNKIFNDLGENIKIYRIESGFSQEYLSKLTGLERSQISKIEQGKVNPKITTLEKISKALNISVSDLLNYDKKYKIHPFVKWAGGKTQLLKQIENNLPKKFNSYYEPFVGGGAVLFKIQPKRAFINDLNNDLLCVYKCLKNKTRFSNLKCSLVMHEKNHNESYYLKIRSFDRNEKYADLEIYDKAARLIYLNKACFNGIYRVNSKGFFNVPSGKKSKVVCFDRKSFDDLYNYFNNSKIKITHRDFVKAVCNAKKGDFVYFDPPYDDWDNKPTFKDYTSNRFIKKDQLRLFNCFKELDKKGVFLMLSNNNTSMIRRLYRDYNVKIVTARRMINRNPNGRGKVEEVLITNY